MAKVYLHDFRKSKLRYIKVNKQFSSYIRIAPSILKLEKDDLKVGNYYYVDGIKLLLYKIYPNNIDYSFKNDKNDVTLYLHSYDMHFEDNKANIIDVKTDVIKDFNDSVNTFEVKVGINYLQITDNGIIKIF